MPPFAVHLSDGMKPKPLRYPLSPLIEELSIFANLLQSPLASDTPRVTAPWLANSFASAAYFLSIHLFSLLQQKSSYSQRGFLSSLGSQFNRDFPSHPIWLNLSFLFSLRISYFLPCTHHPFYLFDSLIYCIASLLLESSTRHSAPQWGQRPCALGNCSPCTWHVLRVNEWMNDHRS